MDRQPQTPSSLSPAELFTGGVWIDVIAAGEAPSRLRVSPVRYNPGAHTAWHRHANGQTLHVTDGVGPAGTRDGQVIVIQPGDTVHRPPGGWALARLRPRPLDGPPRRVGGRGRRAGRPRHRMGRPPHYAEYPAPATSDAA